MTVRDNLLLRPRPPRQIPLGWVQVLNLDFADTIGHIMRTNGVAFRNSAEGVGWITPGTQFSTYDARGANNQSNDLGAIYGYAWPGGFQPITLTNEKLNFLAGTCASVGIDAVAPYMANNTRFVNFGSLGHTWDSFNWKGDFACEVMVKHSLVVGSWGVLWTHTKNADIFNPYAAQFEIDICEFAPADSGNQRILQTNIHGHKVSGNGHTYYSSGDFSPPSWTDLGYVFGGVWRKVLCIRRGDVVTWFVDNVKVKQLVIPNDWIAKDDWNYLRFNNGVSDSAFSTANGGWPGTYAGGDATLSYDYIKFWMPANNLASNLITKNYDDGYGVDICVGTPDPSNTVPPPAFWGTTATDSAGVSKGGQVPAVVASAGSIYNRRYANFASETANNANPYNETGYTNTTSKVLSGHTYHMVLTFEYGSSAKGYVNYSPIDTIANGQGNLGTNVQADIAGTTFNAQNGGAQVSNVAFGTDQYGRNTLTWDWACDHDGGLTFGFGPYSATVGQDVKWYDISCREAH